jgi:hypothetical protein
LEATSRPARPLHYGIAYHTGLFLLNMKAKFLAKNIGNQWIYNPIIFKLKSDEKIQDTEVESDILKK